MFSRVACGDGGLLWPPDAADSVEFDRAELLPMLSLSFDEGSGSVSGPSARVSFGTFVGIVCIGSGVA